MRSVSLTSVVLLGLLPSVGASGQTPTSLGPPASAFGIDVLDVQSVKSTATWKHRVLTGVGASAIGLGLGFFISQVNNSDWSEVPGQFQANRGLWAGVGAGVGFAMGFSFPIRGKARPQTLRARSAADRSIIGPDEFLDVSADNAFEVVRLLRPEWLNTRPPDHLGDLTAHSVPVYLDEFRYGDIDSMRRIHMQNISSIRFVPPARATALWGTGNAAGVIQIITAG